MTAGGGRALVTGAGGFIGANLVRRLLADGHEVTAVVRPDSAAWRLAALKDDLLVRPVDLVDRESVASLVEDARPERVFHLAAHGAYSWQADPIRILETNALGTVALVEACRKRGCGAFVHAGSSSEYGFKDHPPSEDDAIEPNSAYGVAKATATLYCRQVAQAGELNAVTARLYSVYGPWEDPRRLVPTLAVRGLHGELPPLVRPDVARDFVAVEDAVEALLLAADGASGDPGAIYNIGSGAQTTIRQLVEVARRVLGIAAEPAWGSAPERSWDTTMWEADARRASDRLDWRTRVGLEDGFARTVEWLRATPEVWGTYGLDR